VSDDSRLGCSRRARPVAEAPVDALLARAEELAKQWAVALILARPLERIGEIPLRELAREAPALCAQAVRALESDVELERMVAGGDRSGGGDPAAARRLGELAGARDAGSAVEAVEALRGVLWEALMDELRDPPARQVAELADRLACVCAVALAATVTAAPDAPDLAAHDAEFAATGSGPAFHDAGLSPGGGAVIVDEREDLPAPSRGVVLPTSPRASEAEEARARPLPWDMPPPESPRMSRTQPRPLPWYVAPPPVTESGPTPPQAAATATAAEGGGGPPKATSRPEIEIRDERGEEGPAAWIGSIGRRLQRFEQDGLPFAVLLVELVDTERPRRAELSAELDTLISHLEGALAEELRPVADRPAGSLTRERPGRYWLLVGETDGNGARALAERLVRAVSSRAIRWGAPLAVAVGTAVCPEDGGEAAVLAAHADLGLYAARAPGRSPTGRPIDEPL
jgi:GGDEF domain-containing protein